MRKLGVCLAILAGIVFAANAYAQSKEVTLTGKLVDSKCYLMDHSLTGNDHGQVKNCGTLCLKGGTPGGLLTSTNKFYPILAPSISLAPYVGKEVRVRGSLVGTAIDANKVEVNQNGKWTEIRLGNMM